MEGGNNFEQYYTHYLCPPTMITDHLPSLLISLLSTIDQTARVPGFHLLTIGQVACVPGFELALGRLHDRAFLIGGDLALERVSG